MGVGGVELVEFLARGACSESIMAEFLARGAIGIRIGIETFYNDDHSQMAHWRRKPGCTGCWCTREISEWNTHKVILCSEVFLYYRLV